MEINSDPIKWTLCSGHIPIILSVGESATGQLLTLDVNRVTAEVAKVLQPFKVMYLNAIGGITNEKGEVSLFLQYDYVYRVLQCFSVITLLDITWFLI